MSEMHDELQDVELCIQFSDFDGTPNLIREVPLKFIPRAGDYLNVSKEGMTYFLNVDDITHHIDCDTSRHTITINGELKNSYARNL